MKLLNFLACLAIKVKRNSTVPLVPLFLRVLERGIFALIPPCSNTHIFNTQKKACGYHRNPVVIMCFSKFELLFLRVHCYYPQGDPGTCVQ